MRDDVVRRCHDGSTGGHFGITKTQDQVARRAYWHRWRETVRRVDRQCSECAGYHRGAPPKQGRLQPLVTGSSWERNSIDLTGPHAPARDYRARYIITVVDHFTKWAEACPLPNKEATTVARALVEQVFSLHGLTVQICRSYGIDKVRTTAYNPRPTARWRGSTVQSTRC